VPVTLAMPEAFVTAVVELRVTDAPEAGGLKVTVTPERGSPSVSVTFTAKGEPKAVPTFVLCVPPPLTVTELGGPVKFAPTFVVPAIVRLQDVAVPEGAQAPVHPVNVQP